MPLGSCRIGVYDLCISSQWITMLLLLFPLYVRTGKLENRNAFAVELLSRHVLQFICSIMLLPPREKKIRGPFPHRTSHRSIVRTP